MSNNEILSIEYTNCFVAFLDILGFEFKVMESQDRNDKLKILIDSLKICGCFPSGGKKISDSSGPERTIDIRSRFFSDTIVFFLQENQHDIAQLFLVIRYLQDRLWEKEICLRGTVTIGDMYWPDNKNNITIGPSLIKAYKVETQIAIYPRIIVSRDLFGYINHKDIQAYPFGRSGNLTDFIKRDEDGIFFLDLLNENINRFEGEYLWKNEDETIFSICWKDNCCSQHPVICEKLKQTINENIENVDEKVRQRYEWLKSYLEKSLDSGC